MTEAVSHKEMITLSDKVTQEGKFGETHSRMQFTGSQTI
jgi:hypothetical protein